MINRDGALSRRLRAIETQLEATGDAESQELDLPPIVLPRGEELTDEMIYEGAPEWWRGSIFVFPAKVDQEPDPGKRTYLRRAHPAVCAKW
jgi:hypothetical protein